MTGHWKHTPNRCLRKLLSGGNVPENEADLYDITRNREEDEQSSSIVIVLMIILIRSISFGGRQNVTRNESEIQIFIPDADNA